MLYTKSDILNVEFILENCENIIVPRHCFYFITLEEYNESGTFELNCIIDRLDDIEYSGFGEPTYSPIERLYIYNDIVSCNLLMNNGDVVRCELVWEDYGDYNCLQQSESCKFNHIKLSVKIDNYKLFMKDKHQVHINALLEDFDSLISCDDCWCVKECVDLQDSRGISICDVLCALVEEEN